LTGDKVRVVPSGPLAFMSSKYTLVPVVALLILFKIPSLSRLPEQAVGIISPCKLIKKV